MPTAKLFGPALTEISAVFFPIDYLKAHFILAVLTGIILAQLVQSVLIPYLLRLPSPPSRKRRKRRRN